MTSEITAVVMVFIVAAGNVAIVAFMLGGWRSELANAMRRLEKLEQKLEGK